MIKRTNQELQRRLAATESLCRMARAAIKLKMRDSSKLERADDDLGAAIAALIELRIDLGAKARGGADAEATYLAEMGRRFECSYLSAAKFDR